MTAATGPGKRTSNGSVEPILASTRQPGDIGVMENRACHSGAAVERAIPAAGAAVRYLPADSPDLNPIAQRVSKLTAHLGTAAAGTVDRLYEARGAALRSVTHQKIAGWFRSWGCYTRKRKPL